MIKLKLPALFTALIFPSLLIAQYSGFDLSTYRLPDIKTSRLDLMIDLYKTGDNEFSQVLEADPTEYKYSRLSGYLDLNYNRFRNTEKYQSNIFIDAYLQPYFYTNASNENIREFDDIRSDFSIRSTNTFFNKKMNFIEVNPDISFSTTNAREMYDLNSILDYVDTDSKYGTSISIPVSIGHGRIEPVEDARLAIYILEELNKIGRISALPTDDVIIEMAKEISKIKRKRFFDSRIRRIKELQTIDSFLVAKNIISSSDINYFAVLNDQWANASGPARESGFAIGVGIDNQVAFNKLYYKEVHSDDDPESSGDKNNLYKLGGFLKARYAKPINLYWQMYGTFAASYSLNVFSGSEIINDPLENYRSNQIRTDLNYSIQFLPNSRTSISLRVGGSYQNRDEDRTLTFFDNLTDYKIRSNLFSSSSELSLYYYISPQLRVQLNSTLDLSKQILNETNLETLTKTEEETKISRHYIAFHLTYSFF